MEFSETGFHFMLGGRLVGNQERRGGEVHVFVSAELVGCCTTCEDQTVVAVRKLRENDFEHHPDAVRELHGFKFNPSFPSVLCLWEQSPVMKRGGKRGGGCGK